MDLPELERELLQRGRDAWPELKLEEGPFLAALREHAEAIARDEGRPVQEALAGLCAEDLYLTTACIQGERAALEAFDRHCLHDLESVLGRLQTEGAEADEVRQRLRQRLLVGDGTRPARLTQYRGRGALRRWIRVAALREGLHLRRASQAKRIQHERSLSALVDQGDDPELQILKRLYRLEFKQAFQATLLKLVPRDRTILRYQLIDGYNIDEIGAVYGVHRATAARWLARIREELRDGTRDRLATHAKLRSDEVDSVVRLIESQLEVSLVRLLSEDEPEPAEQG